MLCSRQTEIMSPRKVFFLAALDTDVCVRSRGCNCGVRGRGRLLAAGRRPPCALCLQQGSRRTLFIRRQRLQSAGGFSLLLLHCLSHVALRDMSCDSSPAFRRLFFRVTAQSESSFGENKKKKKNTSQPAKGMLCVVSSGLCALK